MNDLISMFKNYLLVTNRNLLKNKVFTLINIIGLGISLAAVLTIIFKVLRAALRNPVVSLRYE